MSIGEPKPTCASCGAAHDELTSFITKTSNRNGNAGRPHLKCIPCKRFITFTDKRGIKDDHPSCDCGRPSRLQAASAAKGRKLHVKCSKGACRYWAKVMDEEGKDAVLPEDLIERMAGIHI